MAGARGPVLAASSVPGTVVPPPVPPPPFTPALGVGRGENLCVQSHVDGMKPAERDTENTQEASETNFITPEGGSENLRGSDQSRILCASVSSSGKWGHNSTYFFLRTNLSNMLRTVPASKKALCTWF